jgi:hypothetical protein
MPLYVYEHDQEPGGRCRERIEVLQQVGEPALTKCPDCGEPCHKVFSPFAALKSAKSMLSTKNLDRLGFTQYKRAGDGYYERATGHGPRVIKGD